MDLNQEILRKLNIILHGGTINEPLVSLESDRKEIIKNLVNSKEFKAFNAKRRLKDLPNISAYSLFPRRDGGTDTRDLSMCGISTPSLGKEDQVWQLEFDIVESFLIIEIPIRFKGYEHD